MVIDNFCAYIFIKNIIKKIMLGFIYYEHCEKVSNWIKKTRKRVSPNEIGLEIGLVLSRFFLDTEHLHFGYWPDDLDVNLDNLKKVSGIPL